MKKSIRFVTYNIHKGLSPFGVKRTLEQIKFLLELMSPDIVCIQEIGSRFVPSNEKLFETQLEFLATTQWPHHSYQKNASYSKGHHGNAILSRWPIEESHSTDLTLNRFEKRGLLHCRIQLEEGETLHVLCTHLNLLGKDRAFQADKIMSYIRENIPSNERVIFSGDFNDWRKKISLEEGFKEAVHSLKGEYAPTFPSFFPVLKLDRIYFKNLIVESAGAVSNSRLKFYSDHLPLQAEFIF